MARRRRPVLVVTLTLVLGGCSSLPDGKRLKDGPAAQRAVARVIGSPMTESENTVMPTGINGQSFTYFGTALGGRYTLVVFDNSTAADFLLGRGNGGTAFGGMRVVRFRNIVVLYTPPMGGKDPGPVLMRSLEQLQ